MSRRFFIDGDLKENTQLSMSGSQYADEIKHLYKVLRKQAGDTVLLINNVGVEAQAQIISIHKSEIVFLVSSVRQIPAHQSQIHLLQGILKGPRMDWLVEKLTELSIDALRPLVTEFVVGIDAQEDTQKRMSRWQKISLSARKQSGASKSLAIQPAQPLTEAIQVIEPANFSIVLSFGANARPIGEVLRQRKPQIEKNICLAVGPEGGFSAAEENFLIQKGFFPASLGNSVLRGETASIVACALTRDWIDFWDRSDITKVCNTMTSTNSKS